MQPNPQHSGERIRWLFSQKELACGRYQRAVASAAGLSQSELRALLCIARHGSLTPSLLRLRLGSSGTALGATLARLDEAGLIERSAHPRDGRTTLLRLTEAATTLLSEGFAGLAERIDEVFAALPARDQRAVADFLAQVADASAAAAAAAEQHLRA